MGHVWSVGFLLVEGITRTPSRELGSELDVEVRGEPVIQLVLHWLWFTHAKPPSWDLACRL